MAGQIPDENKRVDWNTPLGVVEFVKDVFGGSIDLDPCWNPASITNPTNKYSIADRQNGLLLPWKGNKFINPPYGRTFLHKTTYEVLDPKKWKYLTTEQRSEYFDNSISDWIEKTAESSVEIGDNSIMLIPAYVNARYFTKYVFGKASAIAIPNGRFTFEGATSTAAFHVCLPFYGRLKMTERFVETAVAYGYTVVKTTW